jgi:hypothetical protein
MVSETNGLPAENNAHVSPWLSADGGLRLSNSGGRGGSGGKGGRGKAKRDSDAESDTDSDTAVSTAAARINSGDPETTLRVGTDG